MRIATRDSTTKAVTATSTAFKLIHTPYFIVVEWLFQRSSGYSVNVGTLRITKLNGTTIDIGLPFTTTGGTDTGRLITIPLACTKVEVLTDPTGS